MVKGTTIQDFDEETSVQKTLRKPAEQINNWTGKAKTKFAKAFDEVKTTPTKLTGRINDSYYTITSFLKVYLPGVTSKMMKWNSYRTKKS